jgi:Fe-S-cluster containining protein
MPATIRPRIALKLLGEEVAAVATVPAERGRLDQLLPLLLDLDEQAIELAVRKNQKPVSCAKGCSACCRAQPVPITPPEAYAIVRMIEMMLPERRQALEAVFAAREESLREAGLLNVFLRESKITSAEEARQSVERYFVLKLACPFLEDDACSIHPVRPFVCRQYLVTSDPKLCDDPLRNPVDVVPMPMRPAHAMLHVTEKLLGLHTGTIPLVLALAYVRQHRSTLEKQVPMKQAIETWLQGVTT